MIKISAGAMLFLLLGKEKSFCRISEFVEAKRKIEEQVSGVYVDIARKTLLAYVQHYPEYFVWDDTCIKKSTRWKQKDAELCYRYEISSVPDDIQEAIENSLDEKKEVNMKTIEKLVVIDGEEYERTCTVLEKNVNPDRGLGSIKFMDRYGQLCSLQDSSLGTEAAVWLGVDNTGGAIPGPSGAIGEEVGIRMHLTQEMVKQLLPFLQRFAETADYIADMELDEKKEEEEEVVI